MVTGGQTTGTAQLAPTASTMDTPLSREKTVNSPVAASTAVTRNRLDGHSVMPRRPAMTSRREASGIVGAASASLPMRAA